MTEFYHDGNRQLQDQFDTTRIANKINDLLIKDSIGPNDKAFIERMDMFFLATVDEDGHANCSYKGGEPGFVRVIDDTTIAFPNYDGNGMYLSMGNVLKTKQVGLLFIDFENRWRMRLNGVATIDANDPLMAEYPEAQFIVRVKAREVFPNCPRYIHQMKLVQRSKFVPKSECETPVPSWKKGDWAADALPANDPARNPGAEVLDA
jgi:predicted pyridoxine 5'-phosphate oxidase superfamily flavin-nucleotide-binding protein